MSKEKTIKYILENRGCVDISCDDCYFGIDSDDNCFLISKARKTNSETIFKRKHLSEIIFMMAEKISKEDKTDGIFE